MRPEKFRTCLECAIETGIKKIIVGYDGPDKYKKKHEEICDDFPSSDIQFLTFPFNAGISTVRNAMIKEVNTEFILQLDDDNYVPNNVLVMLPFIKRHSEWGGVGMGWLQKNAKYLPVIDAWDAEIVNDYLFRTLEEDKYLENNHSIIFMYPFDFISNNALFRTKLFREFEWDERFKIWGEHEDFFLRVKNESDWKFAQCLSLYIVHDQGGEKDFLAYRNGSEMTKSRNYFLKKWNLKGIAPSRKESMLLDGGWSLYDTCGINKKLKKKLRNNKLSPNHFIKF